MTKHDPNPQLWDDPDTGYRCCVLTGPFGALNGYVRVPDDHPWHGKDYGASLCDDDGCYEHTPEGLIDVHGGLTYAGGPPKGVKESGHWFGFDCAHAGDLVPDLVCFGDDVFRDEEYVRDQCTRLASQLWRVAS